MDKKLYFIIPFLILILIFSFVSACSKIPIKTKKIEEVEEVIEEKIAEEKDKNPESTSKMTEEEAQEFREDIINFIEKNNFGLTVNKFIMKDNNFILEYSSLIMTKDDALKEIFDNVQIMAKISDGNIGDGLIINSINDFIDISTYTNKETIIEIEKYNIGYKDWLKIVDIKIYKDRIDDF